MRRSNGQFERGLIYGVGIDDVPGVKESRIILNGVSKLTTLDPAYFVWKNMLKRCYLGKDVAYSGCVEVCKTWHQYSLFKGWYSENYVEGYQLDKDILSGKIYSPDTCIFVPEEVNLSILKIRRKGTGVWYDSQRNNFQSYITYKRVRRSLGRFKTFNEAKNAHLQERYKILGKYCEEFPEIAWALKTLQKEILSGLRYVEE